MTRRRDTVSWRVKLPLLLILFATLPMVAYGYWTLDLIKRTSEEETLGSLSGLVRAKAEAIDQFTDDRKRDTERIAQLLAPRMTEYRASEGKRVVPPDAPPLPEGEGDGPPVPRPAEEPKATDATATGLRQTLGLILWDQQEFEELLVIDPAGLVVASTFPGHEAHSAAELDYFKGGLKTTFVQPVFKSPISDQLTMMVATPIRDDKREVLGVLAARLNLARFFMVVNDQTGLGETGETTVGEIIDDRVVFMAPTRHDAHAALKRVFALGAPEGRPLQEAARGQDGRGMASDYRGMCVYSAWQHIPALGWGIATKIDCAEALAPVQQARSSMLMVAMLLGMLALLSALLAAQALIRPLRALQHATDRISRGDFDVQIDIPRGDELGDLSDSFERMIAAIKFFREPRHEEEEDEEEIDEPVQEGDEKH